MTAPAHRPVLSREEWERALHPALPARATHGDVRWQMMDRDPIRAVALGNSMLSDDDPRKLTHDDLTALRSSLSLAETCITRHTPTVYPAALALLVHARGVVAKLAALLPPV